MSTQEFYIRGENDTEARGPFTQEQLASLVEAQQVTPETLYYDASIEQWVAVSSNASLLAYLFPEKKRLRMRAKEDIGAINIQRETDAPIRVEDMLAAAEGQTAETLGKGDPKLAAARVASLGRLALMLMLVLSVFAMWAAPLAGNPEQNGLWAMLDPIGSWHQIITDPYLILGCVDLFFALVLLLGATAFYPFIRFRALLVLGFFGLLFYLRGDYLGLGAIAVGSAGAYLATIAITWATLVPAALLGVGGMAALAYLRVFA